jgi:hypothetical protein
MTEPFPLFRSLLEEEALAGVAVQVVIASLNIQSLSRLGMCSQTVKNVCDLSPAAESKWQGAVKEISSGFVLRNLRHHGDPRFKFKTAQDPDDEDMFESTKIVEKTSFTKSSSHKKFKLLFRFQQQRVTELLACFKLGGRSMHGGVCRWSHWSSDDMLSLISQKHNHLGEVAPRRSHLLQVKSAVSVCYQRERVR